MNPRAVPTGALEILWPVLGFLCKKTSMYWGKNEKNWSFKGERGHLRGVDALQMRVGKKQSQTVLGDAVTGQGSTGTNCSVGSSDEL